MCPLFSSELLSQRGKASLHSLRCHYAHCRIPGRYLKVDKAELPRSYLRPGLSLSVAGSASLVIAWKPSSRMTNAG